MTASVLVSCEHAAATVPARYRAAFRGAARALRSHRGSDIGARVLASELAHRLAAPLFAAPATRLLADPNRSAGHPRLFSEWSRRLDASERERILERYWRPHRDAVERAVRARAARGRPVLHLSVHTFAARWQGVARNVDVALLYDPRRARERRFAAAWLGALRALRPDLRLRRNHPYRGVADGLTTSLRRRFDPDLYLGIELEVSQRYPLGALAPWRRLRSDIAEAVRAALASPAKP